MIKPPHSPFFVKPYADASGGVDFLGIRAVNLALMDEFLPSINNVTVRIRPYALISWIAWAFREELVKHGRQEATQSDFQRFREKLEVLFGWSHQLNHAGVGLVGNAQQQPDGVKQVPLRFDDWERNVSWLDAVNYGPSLKTDNGLGFLAQILPGVFTVTEAGESLARALDTSLRKSGDYGFLRSLDSISTSEAIADALYSTWMVSAPKKAEADAFGKILYQPQKAEDKSRNGRRSAAISLILHALEKQDEPVSVDQIRAYMTLNELPNKMKDRPYEAMAQMQGVWRVLQLRQAQRLAAEALFGWIEIRILRDLRNLSSQIVDDLVSVIEDEEEVAAISESWVQGCLARFSKVRKKSRTYFQAARSEPDLNFFAQMAAISQSLADDRDHSVYIALKLLLLCAEIAQELEDDEYCEPYLANGGAARVSLKNWSKFIIGNCELPTKIILMDMVENYFLSQHFGIAAARYTEGKQRLRITIEEGGLVSMLKSLNDAWHPNVTRDRLAAVLSLMADCRLVHRKMVDDEDCYSI